MEKILAYWKRNLDDIRREGWTALFRKMRSFLIKFMRTCGTIFLSIPVAPFVLLVRMLRPFVLVRFGCLFSERIGHLAMNTEVYLCKRDLSEDKYKTFDMFCHSCKVANKQLVTFKSVGTGRFQHWQCEC